MSIEIKRSDKYVDYNISATNNRGYITIDTSDWINKPWMFYELPALKFEIYTETDGELVKYQNFTREIRTYNPVYSPLGVLNVTIDIRNVPEEFILRITPIFDNDAVTARNMLVENGIENGDIWGSDQDVPTQLFNLDLEFIECDGEYVPPTPPVPPTHEETITGVPPIAFDGSTGEPLVSWTILGNGSQIGTPTPDNPVMPTFCGVSTGNLWDLQSWTNTTTDTRSYFQLSITLYNGSTSFGECRFDVHETGRVSLTSVTAGADGATRLAIKHNGSTRDLAIGNVYDVPANQPLTISFDVSGYDPTIAGGISISNIMINLGSTALPYEPYGWAEKITCAGQTVPVYLGQTQTVRKIRKLVLTGAESSWGSGTSTVYLATAGDTNTMLQFSTVVSSHYTYHSGGTSSAPNNSVYTNAGAGTAIWFKTDYGNDVDSFKSYLAAQYAAGTPVTVWYVLAEPTTGIVNEPLAKIGDYADELHITNEVTIPTVKGSNTLTVDTPIQPSEMTITYTKEE